MAYRWPLFGGGCVHPQLDDYSYDSLNRITSVTEAQLDSGGNRTFNLFKQNFDYDRWGNRMVWCSPGQPGVTCDTFTIEAATNRITAKNGYAMTYDAAGNQTYDCVGTHYYDAENRMTKAVQGSSNNYYFYDGNGKRVRRILNGSQTWGGDVVRLRLRRRARGRIRRSHPRRDAQERVRLSRRADIDCL